MNIIAVTIMLGILFISYFIVFIFDLNRSDINQHPIFKFIQIMCVLLIMVLSVGMVIRLSEMNEQVKGKCPELERIENVYRIK